MRNFFSYLKSYDAFGEPIGLNYDGESTYKTLLGALVTIAIKAFLLIFATTQTIALFQYQDPTISQVSDQSTTEILSKCPLNTLFFFIAVLSLQSKDKRRGDQPQ